MHVHITPVGFSREPILKVISKLSGIDALFLLHTNNDESRRTAEDIRDSMSCMIPHIVLRTIPFSDFMGIVSVIYGIHEEMRSPDTGFSVNITAGTNLMAAATCYSSYYIGARMFYSLNSDDPIDKQVIEITAPRAVDVSGYSDLTREILGFMAECRSNGSVVTNSLVSSRFGINKQKANYHVRILLDDGLVEKRGYVDANGRTDGRRVELVLTPQGVMIADTL